MSCAACTAFADDPARGHYFYRWKHANVEIVACREHVKEIMDALSAAQTLAHDIVLDFATPTAIAMLFESGVLKVEDGALSFHLPGVKQRILVRLPRPAK